MASRRWPISTRPNGSSAGCRTIEDEVRDAVLEEAARRVRDAFRAAGPDADPVKGILEGKLSVDQAAARLLADTVRQAGARKE